MSDGRFKPVVEQGLRQPGRLFLLLPLLLPLPVMRILSNVAGA